jgi:twitching motility protein PilT
MRLSEALRAIISQQLLPQKDDKGRVAAVEVLLATGGVRDALKHPARMGDLRKHMSDGQKQLGTQTFDQHLAELVEAGLITQETAKAALSMGAPPTAAPVKKGSKQAASA